MRADRQGIALVMRQGVVTVTPDVERPAGVILSLFSTEADNNIEQVRLSAEVAGDIAEALLTVAGSVDAVEVVEADPTAYRVEAYDQLTGKWLLADLHGYEELGLAQSFATRQRDETGRKYRVVDSAGKVVENDAPDQFYVERWHATNYAWVRLEGSSYGVTLAHSRAQNLTVAVGGRFRVVDSNGKVVV